MKIDSKDFHVPPGKPVNLAKWPTHVKPVYKSKKEYHKILEAHVEELSSLQRLHYASNRHALLLIFQGMDAAGKDGAIRHVMSGINPQGCQVFSFKQPGAEELDHDFLWRTTRRLPERGRIGIFNRSYYEEVLIVRVHPELLNRQRLPNQLPNAKTIWKDRYRSIGDLEEHLHRNGTRIIKFFLDLSVTGLTSNPTIFDHAIKNSAAYDGAIREAIAKGKTGEGLFFDLALDDLTRAADLFRPIHERTNGVDGWVSLEVSPLLAHDTTSTIAAARELSGRAGRPNLFIKIPGTKEGLPAIEEAIFAGVPVNVTLLFSREQYAAAAEAYLRGIERRIAAGLNPQVGSVASIFISRWDAAVAGKVPQTLNNRLGIAIAGPLYKAYLDLLRNPRCQRAYNAGARPQRLLWASTGTKDPKASDILYIKALASPFTVNTMPEGTLKALADHGDIGPTMAAGGGDCEAVLAQFREAGINPDALAAQLQDEGAQSFVKSWNDLLAVIASKSDALKKTKGSPA